MGCHLPYGITQCYLTPDTKWHNTPRFNPSQTGRYSFILFFLCVYFVFLCVFGAFSAVFLCCQYQYKWLPEKTRLRNDLLFIERDVKLYALHFAATSSLIVSHTRLCTISDRAFPVAAARVWNSLPDLVTSAPSIAVFRSLLKTHLFNISYPSPLWLYSARTVTLSCFGHYNRFSLLLTGLLRVTESLWIFFQIFKVWKVLENRHGPWKSLNLCLKVLESAWITFSKTPWLAIVPQKCWWSLQCSPRLPSWIWGVCFACLCL